MDNNYISSMFPTHLLSLSHFLFLRHFPFPLSLFPSIPNTLCSFHSFSLSLAHKPLYPSLSLSVSVFLPFALTLSPSRSRCLFLAISLFLSINYYDSVPLFVTLFLSLLSFSFSLAMVPSDIHFIGRILKFVNLLEWCKNAQYPIISFF